MEIAIKNQANAGRKAKKNKCKINSEDMEILSILKVLKHDLDSVHKNLDFITDPVLIDGYIYEMQAIHMKYAFYLRLCKEKGLVGEIACETSAGFGNFVQG